MTKITNEQTEPVMHQEKTSAGKFDRFGRFLPDSRPMEAAFAITPGPSLIEQIRSMVQSENLAKELRASGQETFEEANDFFVEEDPDSYIYSPYEFDEDADLETFLEASRRGIRPDHISPTGEGEEPPPEPLKTRAEPASKRAQKARGAPSPTPDEDSEDDR